MSNVLRDLDASVEIVMNDCDSAFEIASEGQGRISSC